MIAVLITNFIDWFFTKFVYIASTLLNYIQGIQLTTSLNLLTFIVLITIIGAFMSILLNSTKLTGNKISSKVERKRK